MATSGRVSATLRSASGADRRLADDLDAGLGQQPREPLAQQRLVVGEHYAHGSSATSAVAVRRAARRRARRRGRRGRRAAPAAARRCRPRARSRPSLAHGAHRGVAATPHRLRDDVVRGRLDLGGEPLRGQRPGHDDARVRGLGERLHRRAEPLVGEHRRDEAVRDLAQRGERARGRRQRVGQGCRAFAARRACARPRSRRRASPAAAGRRRGDRARAAVARASPAATIRAADRPQILQPRLQLRVQALAAQREPRRLGDRGDDLGIIEQAGPVEQLGLLAARSPPARGAGTAGRPTASSRRPSASG